MHAQRLTKEVTLSSASTPANMGFWNTHSTLSIRPTSDPSDLSWYWEVAGKKVRIVPQLFQSKGRWIELVYKTRGKTHRFKEFEHIAFLYAMGLRGIIISLQGSWPPYLCSPHLWQLVQPHLQSNRIALTAWHITEARSRISKAEPTRGLLGSVSALPPEEGFEDYFALSATVDYGPHQSASVSIHINGSWSIFIEPTDWHRVVSARSLGRPSWLYVVGSILSRFPLVRGRRWPHMDRVLWQWQGTSPKFWTELALHKLLDGMILSFVAEPHEHLVGALSFYRSNHPHDLELLRTLLTLKNVELR